MTETEWRACDNADAMLEFLRERASARKLRLFAVAACRRGWGLFLFERSREAVNLAEQFADGAASADDLRTARAAALAVYDDARRAAPRSEFNWWGSEAAGAAFACTAPEAFPPLGRPAPQHDYFVTAAGFMSIAVALVTVRELEIEGRLDELPDDGTFDDARHDLYDRVDVTYKNIQQIEGSAQADLLRDIFGSPFRSAAFDAAWRTDTAVALAHHVYESGDFGAAPILADALQDAGCDDEELLAHLRDAITVHVRGCWAVDRVLGRE